MSAIGITRPPSLAEQRARLGRDQRDGLAIASVSSAAVAVLALFVAPIRGIGLPACALAVLLGLVAWRRARRDDQPLSVQSWAGPVLAAMAAAALIGSPAAFGSVSDGHTTPALPATVPAAGPAVQPGTTTAAVLSRDITVSFGAPHTLLDDTGQVMSTVPVSIANISGHSASFNVVFEARDAKGKLVTTDSAFVPDLAAGQTAQIRVFNLVNDKLVPNLLNAHYSVSEAMIE
jgi:hypothetical protein